MKHQTRCRLIDFLGAMAFAAFLILMWTQEANACGVPESIPELPIFSEPLGIK